MTDNNCNQGNKKPSIDVGDSISLFIIVIARKAGVVLSPPYARYLFIERVMKVTGLI